MDAKGNIQLRLIPLNHVTALVKKSMYQLWKDIHNFKKNHTKIHASNSFIAEWLRPPIMNAGNQGVDFLYNLLSLGPGKPVILVRSCKAVTCLEDVSASNMARLFSLTSGFSQ